MYESIQKLNTMEYTIAATERLRNGDFHHGKSFNKFQAKPFRLYMKIISKENNGVELLYNEPAYGNSLIVNAAKWLPNLKFDPMGTNMRKNQHHTIFESGFSYGIGILMKSKSAAGAKFDESVVMDPNASTNGRACFKLTVTDKNFHYYNYTAQAGENTYKLAASKNICEYLILERNSFLKDFSSSIAGKSLSIPSGYAPKTIIYIDKQTMLPISLEMDDEKGLLEKYEFLDIKVNPTIGAEEFTKDYSEYGF